MNMAEQPFLPSAEAWLPVRDGNCTALSIFERHYSCSRSHLRRIDQFVGPGEKYVLLTPDATGLFVWRKFIDHAVPTQTGINCAVFRNEGGQRSSDLIREADKIADARWPGERHYTYVNAKRIKSTNPGYCFLQAGWQRCGVTKGGLHILERIADRLERMSVGRVA